MNADQVRLAKAAELLALKMRHRRFTWCRRHNGFSDQPIWRVVAALVNLPLFQVQAFVNRLEEFANAAVPRGFVGDLNLDEFAVALGMPAEEAARIFAALERQEVGWVVQEHVHSFHDRNPDKEDKTAGERKERWRARQRKLKAIASAFRRGLITEAERARQEAEALGLEMSTGNGGTIGNGVPDRDIVPVTPRAEQLFTTPTVDNFAAAPRGETAGSAKEGRNDSAASSQDAAEQWVAVHGLRIVTKRMALLPSLAATRIERWKRELAGDAEALAAILDAADQADLREARFHVAVTDQISRRLRDAEGPRLPLMQVKRGGAA